MKYHVAHIHTSFAEEWQADVFNQQLFDLGFDTIDGEDAYIPTEQWEVHQSEIETLCADTPGVSLRSVEPCPDEDWNATWEAEHPVEEMALGVRIIPHCAFGAGHHETTSMLVETLMKSDLSGKRVLDHGTGTGILAIYAKRLGAAEVIAVDIDEKSVENAEENAALNNEHIFVRLGHTVPDDVAPLDLILANIHRNIILDNMKAYAQALAPNGELWISGFYDSDCDALINEANRHGLTLIETTTNNEWRMIRFVKKGEPKTHFALVTGASSGMGLEFAKQLALRDYNLLIVSNEEAIHDAAEKIRTEVNRINLKRAGAKAPNGGSHKPKAGVHIIPLVMDLGQQSSARELYDYTHAHGIEIEVLVNNAGVYHDRDILDDSEAFTSLIMNLHMYTPAMLCYLFGQDMKARGKGYILNVCSVTAKMAAQRLGTYGSTKAFLNNFTRALHIELKPYGVYVTNVSPGAVDTGLYSIRPWMTKLGKVLGIIASPQALVRRALRALFRGRSKVTIPAVFWHFLTFLILLIPTCVLRLIRRLKLF